MGNIVDYIAEVGASDFEERPFAALDAIVLCEFSYLKFDELVPGMAEKPVTISELNEASNKEVMFMDKRYGKDHKALFETMLMSKRFGGLKICCYINRVEPEAETQFAAVTFLLQGHVFIAFRGTDENMVGWQEDFKLALKRPTTGQVLSAKYINDVSDRFPGKFMVGGHSKGGNLAIYASMCAHPGARERISKIYSFDAPGFRSDVLEERGYEEIRKRVLKVIPESSFVGMLFGMDDDAVVIDSKSSGFSQHDMYKWVVKEGHLIKAHITDSHKILLKGFNEWVLGLDEERLERFVKFLCKLLDSTEAATTREFQKNFFKHSFSAIKATSELDEETKEFLGKFVKSYFEVAFDVVKDSIKNP